jgi:hypothetical protein
MEWIVALILLGILMWLLTNETLGDPIQVVTRKRLCDYFVAGGVHEPLADVLARGSRLYEVHVYSDEQDQPVVAKKPQNDGYDYAEDNIPFERVCVDIVNDAFPSKDPFILSIVLHSEKTIIANRVAEHLATTVRRHLMPPTNDLAQAPLDSLENKLILVSGGGARGTDLEPLITLFWTDQSLRRLSWHEAAHPRDPSELLAFAKDHLVLVAPHPELRILSADFHRPEELGCQWNLFDRSGGGFIERSAVKLF